MIRLLTLLVLLSYTAHADSVEDIIYNNLSQEVRAQDPKIIVETSEIVTPKPYLERPIHFGDRNNPTPDIWVLIQITLMKQPKENLDRTQITVMNSEKSSLTEDLVRETKNMDRMFRVFMKG